MNQSDIKIIVAVVTYNRLKLLRECLASLSRQSAPIATIIVVNNGSTDGTTEWLATQSQYKVINQENTGGAGGFHTGAKAAYNDGADWIWVMDDDVEVADDCLANMLKYTDRSECIHPNKYDANGKEIPWEGFMDTLLAIDFKVQNMSFRNGKDICYVNIGCFEGMLFKASLIDKIGFPDARFFIVYDDVIYGLLASFHTNVSMVRNARLVNKKQPGISHETDMYLYYYIRNKHLIEEYLDKYFPGNKISTRSIVFKLYVLKKMLSFPFSHRKGLKNQLKTMKVVYRAYQDYKKKKTGKTF